MPVSHSSAALAEQGLPGLALRLGAVPEEPAVLGAAAMDVVDGETVPAAHTMRCALASHAALACVEAAEALALEPASHWLSGGMHEGDPAEFTGSRTSLSEIQLLWPTWLIGYDAGP
jgi:hypothetical protein